MFEAEAPCVRVTVRRSFRKCTAVPRPVGNLLRGKNCARTGRRLVLVLGMHEPVVNLHPHPDRAEDPVGRLGSLALPKQPSNQAAVKINVAAARVAFDIVSLVHVGEEERILSGHERCFRAGGALMGRAAEAHHLPHRAEWSVAPVSRRCVER
jgi:hypothetical protein